MRIFIGSQQENRAFEGAVEQRLLSFNRNKAWPSGRISRGLITLLISISLLFFCNGCFLAEKVKPKDPYLWDFAKVKKGDVLKHAFQLKNTAGDVLTINHVRSSCGCTGTVVSAHQIPPGGTSEIEVTFDTKGYSGETKQYVYVHTNSPITPIIRLTVKAQIMDE